MSFYQEIGFMRYPLIIVTMFMLLQTGRGIIDVARSGESDGAMLRIHSILILGVLGACLGVLGTLVGLSLAASVAERVTEVSPRLMWGGVRVTLGTSIVGFLMLGYSSIVWLALQYAKGRREIAVR